MPKRQNNGELPLPEGWDVATDFDGKIYYIDHINKKTTWVDPRDRYTKPQSFADCIGDELPLGWEESYDKIIGRYYINHCIQSTQLEDPRQEWKSIQEHMLREYLTSAQEVLVAKQEILDVKQQRLQLAQDEYNQLSALAVSRSSLCSSSSSINRHDPELLKAELALAKERVWKLKRELVQITSDISYTQRGVDTLNSVEQKLSAHENGCYNISEVQAIREEMMKVQKSLVSGGKVKDDLMKSLAHIKNELKRQQHYDNSNIMNSSPYSSVPQDRVCVASQTDLCTDNFNSGSARFAEMAKTKLQYGEWRKRIKQLQQKLADHVEKIEPGQLESDKDRLLLIQEKEQYLKELRSLSLNSKSEKDAAAIQEECRKLHIELNNAYELSNQCIANRLKLHEEKQVLLQQLQDALKSTKMLEERLKSFSSGSTFSISSGSSMGSLSTASSKNSLSALSFTDIYGDPLTVEPHVDMTELHCRSQRLSNPSEVSLSPRSSLSVETPPSSPLKYINNNNINNINNSSSSSTNININHNINNNSINNMESSGSCSAMEEPTYENTKNFAPATYLDNAAFDCIRLEERLSELEIKQRILGPPLSPIYEKPSSILDLPQSVLSHTSSLSNTRSVSAAVSNESVAGDSGVFEASRALLSNKESAQVQIALKYSKCDLTLHVTIERARNLTALNLQNNCQLYLRAALLPNSKQYMRTNIFTEFEKPVFGDSFLMQIPLNKIYTKTLQINVVSVMEQREEIIGCAQVSLAEFNIEDSTLKWYNILSFQIIKNFEPFEMFGGCKEESSDESTIISSQTSTLTRNMGQEDMHATACMSDFEVRNSPLDLQESSEDHSAEDDNESTEQMLANYMSEVHNFTAETVDKETNTECGFLPEKHRNRFNNSNDKQSNLATSSSSNNNEQSAADERIVKRSQTFSPSAVVSNRYICRLNRSDSDSAMHFNSPSSGHHSFQRGAVERRSLRFHSKVLKNSSSKTHANAIPRTSLDLELDLQAQHTKLETLNDEITKLKDLKQRLEEALDNKDRDIANWAVENEDFKRLLENVAVNKAPEEKQLEKLLHKTSKEIYKLRKTRLPKGQPDFVSFKEKMAFFTRKGLTVPEYPKNTPLEETPEELSLPSQQTAAITLTDSLNARMNQLLEEEQYDTTQNNNNNNNNDEIEHEPTKQEVEEKGEEAEGAEQSSVEQQPSKNENSKYAYVIDRTYGVEV